MKYIFILGKTPLLSRAEIISVLKRENIEYSLSEQGDNFLILNIRKKISAQNFIDGLGGTIKIGELSKEIKDLNELNGNFFIGQLPLEENKKIFFGFSLYNLSSKAGKTLQKLGLSIKKELKEKNISARLVSSKEEALSSVVVQKNKLLSNRGKEFLIIQSGGGIFIGKTLAVQNFAEYSRRDFGRPARDTLSGTLPPKLAQIMINLTETKKSAVILDPFCGSGTILSEALLMGYTELIGTDKSAKAVADSKKNLQWLSDNYNLPVDQVRVEQLDATELSSQIKKYSINTIASEPYLGPPLRSGESENKIKSIIRELSDLYLQTFKQFAQILKPNGKVVIIIPAFKYKKEILKIPVIKKIENLGFRPVISFMYSRPDQKVLREIFIFDKIKKS